MKNPKMDYYNCKEIDLNYKELKEKLISDIDTVEKCISLSGIFKLEILDLQKED